MIDAVDLLHVPADATRAGLHVVQPGEVLSAPRPVARTGTLARAEASILSPLRYPGSKRRFGGYVRRALELSGLKPEIFVEPFAGGASVALQLLNDGLVEKIGLIDRDPLVAAFWETVFFDTNWLGHITIRTRRCRRRGGFEMGVEDALSVPWQVRTMGVGKSANMERAIEAKDRPRLSVERAADNDRAIVVHRDETSVERYVEVWREKDAVVHIEPLCVCVANGPGFYVTRAEERGYREARNGTSPLPKVEEPVSEQILAYTLNRKTFDLGAPRQRRHLLLERVEELIRKSVRQLERATKESV